MGGRQGVGRRLARFTIIATVGWAAGGCRARAAPAAPAAPAALALEFIDDFNPPRPPGAEASTGLAPSAAWDRALGGLSGLFYSAPEALLYAISDDRGRYPPRLYTFGVELGERALRIVPRGIVWLHESVPTGTLIEMDGEGLGGNGQTLFMSLEGNAEPPSQRETRVFRVARDGLVTGQLSVPPAFRPAASGQPPRGARANLGFEGLSLSPSGRFLLASAEVALFQDGAPATFDEGTLVRFARWDLQQSGDATEYHYRTDPVVPRLDAPSVAHTGVSEVLALDDGRLLVMERAYVAAGERRVNTIRLFEVELPAVAGAPAALDGGAALPFVPKRLVLDLADVVARFDDGLQELDNFEGMTLGPRLPSGNPSVLLVSDDNFSASQRTVFLAFELHGATR